MKKLGIFSAMVLLVALGYAFREYPATGVMPDGDSLMGLYMLMLAVMCVLAITYGKTELTLLAARKWPYVAGRIFDVQQESDIYGNKKTTVTYNYTVNDIPYTNDVFDHAQPNAEPALIKYILNIDDETPVDKWDGMMVRVYYNPKNPYHSVLSRKLTQADYPMLIPSVIVILFTVILFGKLLVDWGLRILGV
ncbi:DUF3592 domain-containing protein [Neptuniibacter sp. QD37_11]|uniref:DUF3592 domain-containing protein n=1 Tax=Neptuniibacter sp. QD37_11 TaxID=3398209 RepID=UPI0039F5C267